MIQFSSKVVKPSFLIKDCLKTYVQPMMKLSQLNESDASHLEANF